MHMTLTVKIAKEIVSLVSSDLQSPNYGAGARGLRQVRLGKWVGGAHKK